MTALPSRAELGQIRTKDGRSYQITPEDVLWLARAAKYEGGGSHAATLWTWAQRFAINANMNGSLAGMVRAHSQPVNPLWDEASDAKCIQYPERCTPAHLARRAQAVSASWSSLGQAAADAVAFAQARMPNPVPHATDFADPQVSQSFLARNPDARVVLRTGNWYIAEARALGLPADFTTIAHAGRVAGPGSTIPAWLGLSIGGAFLLFGVGLVWATLDLGSAR